jgi:hypothetical protein
MSALAFTLALSLSIPSGVYDPGLTLSIQPETGYVNGQFLSATVGGQFSCHFTFSGTLEGERAAILSYAPTAPHEAPIPGELKALGDGKVQVTLEAEHGGCWNVRHFSNPHDPAVFTLSHPLP